MAMFKLLCMQAQGCPNFEKVESMIASRKSDNMQRFAKAIHQKMKTNNIFRDVPERKGYFYRTTNLGNFQITNYVVEYKVIIRLKNNVLKVEHSLEHLTNQRSTE